MGALSMPKGIVKGVPLTPVGDFYGMAFMAWRGRNGVHT